MGEFFGAISEHGIKPFANVCHLSKQMNSHLNNAQSWMDSVLSLPPQLESFLQQLKLDW